jgi:hypothetical protein
MTTPFSCLSLSTTPANPERVSQRSSYRSNGCASPADNLTRRSNPSVSGSCRASLWRGRVRRRRPCASPDRPLSVRRRRFTRRFRLRMPSRKRSTGFTWSVGRFGQPGSSSNNCPAGSGS